MKAGQLNPRGSILNQNRNSDKITIKVSDGSNAYPLKRLTMKLNYTTSLMTPVSINLLKR